MSILLAGCSTDMSATWVRADTPEQARQADYMECVQRHKAAHIVGALIWPVGFATMDLTPSCMREKGYEDHPLIGTTR